MTSANSSSRRWCATLSSKALPSSRVDRKKDMSQIRYHIAQRGKNVGKPVRCRAKETCAIGDLTSEELTVLRPLQKNSYTEERLAFAADAAKSWGELLNLLGASQNRQVRYHIASRMDAFGISYAHLKSGGYKRAEGETAYTRRAALTAMLSSGLPYECSKCKQSRRWHGRELTIEIDHIDGNRQNNGLKNLRFLCPNCHAQTPGHSLYKARRLIQNALPKPPKDIPIDFCSCGKIKSTRFELCMQCTARLYAASTSYPKGRLKAQTVDWPSEGSLIEKIKATSRSQVARELGVSHPTLLHHLRRRGWDTTTLTKADASKPDISITAKKQYKDLVILQAISLSRSYSEALTRLQEVNVQISFTSLRRDELYRLANTSHFDIRLKKDVVARTKSLEDILVLKPAGSKRTKSNLLFRAMVQSGMKYKCEVCGNQGFWQGKPLNLGIDHENGDSLDNRIVNLRFLCSNCHTQQATGQSGINTNKVVNEILFVLHNQ